MPAQFLLPLAMAAGGAGLGALSNEEDRLGGALSGGMAGASAGFGMAGMPMAGQAAGAMGSIAGGGHPQGLPGLPGQGAQPFPNITGAPMPGATNNPGVPGQGGHMGNANVDISGFQQFGGSMPFSGGGGSDQLGAMGQLPGFFDDPEMQQLLKQGGFGAFDSFQ